MKTTALVSSARILRSLSGSWRILMSQTSFPATVSVCFALLCHTSPLCAQDITLPSSLIAPGETLHVLKSGMAMTEGPVVDSTGNLFFTVPFENAVWRISPAGEAVLFDSASNGANGLVFDCQDRLIACEKQRLTRLEPDGSESVLATFDGWANDVSLAPDGGIYFTQPTWDTPESSYVFYRSPTGELHTLLEQVPGFPNGIEYVAEKNRLYVAYSQRNAVMTYTLGESNAFVDSALFTAVTTPDGFALDGQGNLWIASNSASRVEVYDSSGQSLGHIAVTGQSSIQNCAFGGPGNATLYIAGATAVLSLQTRVRGRSTRGDAGVGVESGRHGSFFRHSGAEMRMVRRAGELGVTVFPGAASALSVHTLRGRLVCGNAIRSPAKRTVCIRPAAGCFVWRVHANGRAHWEAAVTSVAGR